MVPGLVARVAATTRGGRANFHVVGVMTKIREAIREMLESDPERVRKIIKTLEKSKTKKAANLAARYKEFLASIEAKGK
jgi:hypothetical protein